MYFEIQNSTMLKHPSFSHDFSIQTLPSSSLLVSTTFYEQLNLPKQRSKQTTPLQPNWTKVVMHFRVCVKNFYHMADEIKQLLFSLAGVESFASNVV